MKFQHKRRTVQALITGLMAMCLVLLTALPASAKSVSDKDITSAINSEIWINNAVSANDIDVTTQNGIVTLKGTVNSILAKERAEALAGAIIGVRAIINKVLVAPAVLRDDKELGSAVENAWFTDPAADSYKLKAEADDGIVTITGTVESYAERDLSETIAKGVRGVKGINNRIKVNYRVDRSDAEIQGDVKKRLKNDIRVDDYLITVQVKKGDVTLSGIVGSLQEKNQAAIDAWVAGVSSVSTEDLDIEWWARDKMRRKSRTIARTDEEIKKAVKDAFFYEPRVLSFKPEVEVRSGTVTLSGVVDNLQAKHAAEAVAKNTLGVWRVKNHLKVRPEIPKNDVLEQRVAAALLNDPYVQFFDVTVQARNGWVDLSGDVNNSFAKSQAERVAERVKGVVGVFNNLDYDYLWLWKPDWEIRAEVEDQLKWSVFVDSEDINVSVDNGVVTLNGEVDSLSELHMAEENAYQGGAKNVHNNLEVDNQYYGPYGPSYYTSPYYYGPPYDAS